MSDLNTGSTLTPNQQRMATENIKSLVFRYSIPTIIGMLVNALYNVVDRFWVGQMPDVGEAALTGLGLAMPVMTIVFAFAQLVGTGSSANISITLGRKDMDAAEGILGNTLSLSVIVAVCITILGLIFMEPLLSLTGGSDATIPYSISYLRIILSGCIFQIISFCMNSPIRGLGDPKRFASTQLLGGVLNMILDPVFIFVFDMGIQGAALATILSQFISASWVLSYYFSPKAELKLKRIHLKPRLKWTKSIFSIGFSMFLMQLSGSLILLLANWSLKKYGDIELGNGDVAVGAFTIISSVHTLFFMPVLGFNQGAQPIIGYNYGAGNYSRMKEAYKWHLIYSTIVTMTGFCAIQLFAPYLAAFFNDSQRLVDVASFGMRIFLCGLPVMGIQAASTNFFLAIGRPRISIMLNLLRQVFLMISFYLLLPLIFGLKGIWMAAPCSDIIATAVTLYFIVREIRRLGV